MFMNEMMVGITVGQMAKNAIADRTLNPIRCFNKTAIGQDIQIYRNFRKIHKLMKEAADIDIEAARYWEWHVDSEEA